MSLWAFPVWGNVPLGAGTVVGPSGTVVDVVDVVVVVAVAPSATVIVTVAISVGAEPFGWGFNPRGLASPK
jgi:hypothetical protein